MNCLSCYKNDWNISILYKTSFPIWNSFVFKWMFDCITKDKIIAGQGKQLISAHSSIAPHTLAWPLVYQILKWKTKRWRDRARDLTECLYGRLCVFVLWNKLLFPDWLSQVSTCTSFSFFAFSEILLINLRAALLASHPIILKRKIVKT